MRAVWTGTPHLHQPADYWGDTYVNAPSAAGVAEQLAAELRHAPYVSQKTAKAAHDALTLLAEENARLTKGLHDMAALQDETRTLGLEANARCTEALAEIAVAQIENAELHRDNARLDAEGARLRSVLDGGVRVEGCLYSQHIGIDGVVGFVVDGVTHSPWEDHAAYRALYDHRGKRATLVLMFTDTGSVEDNWQHADKMGDGDSRDAPTEIVRTATRSAPDMPLPSAGPDTEEV